MLEKRILLLVACVVALSGGVYRRSVVAAGTGRAPATSIVSTPSTSRHIQLIIDDDLLARITDQIPADFRVTPKSRLEPQPLLDGIGAGDSLVWIGAGDDIPRDLWVGTFRPSTTALRIRTAEHAPAAWRGMVFRQSHLSSAYIRPAKEMPYHNVDEGPRADFLPLLEAADRFGQAVGYPGVLMHYYAPSSVRHRFAGSECFFFLFDSPAKAMDADGWVQLLKHVDARFRAQLQIQSVKTDYASYRVGERVLIRARVANRRPQAAAAYLHFYTRSPGAQVFRELITFRRSPDAENESEAVADFVPHGPAGLWTIRVEAWQDPDHAEELGMAGNPVLVDRRDMGFILLDGPLRTPAILTLSGPTVRLNGQEGFWVGTNYYPSSSWWDWLWRDLRPLNVAQDFSAMRRTGYRIVRTWIDPFLDEQSLRAMDAAIYIAAQHGIVLDVCIFFQWVRTIGFERENGEHVTFDFRGMRDFNIYGISLRNLALQREYMDVLARRWSAAGNIVYDLSNETYLKDPDSSQMDPEVLSWKGIPSQPGIRRDTLLFRRWAKEITAVIRKAGGTQPVMPGYLFSTLGGGDTYLGNRDGDIEPWHNYSKPESAGWTLAYEDPIASDRPVILEEFGAAGWNSKDMYEGAAEYALAGGAAAAMSYEWGVGWLAEELDYTAQPLREALDFPPDPRWFTPAMDLAKTWSHRAVGIHPAPSGFTYGSIYHGTPFPAEAAVALGRLGRMGQGLGRAQRPEQVYVLVPTAFNGSRTGMDPVTEAIAKLWQEKVVFGIVQEDCLGSLPKSTRLLICPNGVSAAGEEQLDELRRRGVEVVAGRNDAWLRSPRLKRLQVMPGDGVNLLVRRTLHGTLYSLMSSGPTTRVTLRTESGNVVTLGLNKFAMVQEIPAGINWVQANEQIAINGSPVCSIDRGRAILASNDALDLLHTRGVSLLSSEPTTIIFAQPIASISVQEESVAEPLATFAPEQADRRVLKIDSELVRYVLQVRRDFGR